MEHSSSSFITVFVTAPPDQAGDIANTLVGERLAACANILPAIRSIYSWKGEICDDQESLLVLKTRAPLFDALRRRVVEVHPYEVPEVIALPLVEGHPPYLQWILDSTGELKDSG